MRTTVRPSKPGYGHGLGIMSTRLPCGRTAWYHNGAVPGFETWSAATDDGRAASVTMTVEPTRQEETVRGKCHRHGAVPLRNRRPRPRMGAGPTAIAKKFPSAETFAPRHD
ncbi:hypothetical protein AB0C76_19955 [Kitasatospora sp. NPDC048722]|uniref:hypothetical protein n=1 Tax=Kitasatospora sp. NPDC048722 TaxID=3155639 RepID=UPI0033CBBC6C